MVTNHFAEEYTCTICQTDLQQGDDVVREDINGHIFHRACLN